MSSFAETVFSYPTAVFSVLLGVVMVYWVLAMIGLVDFESGGLDLDLDLDANAGGIGTLASYLVAIGLGGVPFSIVVSLLVLISWTLCSLASMWLLPLVPTSVLGTLAATAVLLAAPVVAIPLAAIAVRPLRGLFVTHAATSNAALVGQTCRIVTRNVDEGFGRAEVESRGTSYNIRVIAATPNPLVRGSTALIIDYDPAAARYRVQALDDTG
ncbi:MAG: hypothetical protein ACK4KV_18620 [Rhodocyclaceae bacterium]